MAGPQIRLALIAHLSEKSGAGVALLNTARFLDRERFDAVLVLPGSGPLADNAQKSSISFEILENPEVSLTSARGFEKLTLLFSRIGYVARLRRFLRKGRFDLAYVNSTASIFAGIAAKLAGLPIIWHVHEMIEHPSRATRFKMWMIERLSSGLVYASRSAQQHFPARRVRAQLIARNYIELHTAARAAKSGSESGPHQLGVLLPQFAPDEIVITMNGTFHRKAPDVFIEAAALLTRDITHPLRFVIIGAPPAGEERFFDTLKNIASEFGISDRVVFAGFQPSIGPFLLASTMFVSPSRNEAMPIALLEAMAAGVPVVSSDTGDCADLLERGALGAVVPRDDAAALANAMREIIDHPEPAAQRAMLAQARVLETYSAPDFWEPLEKFIEEMLQDSASQGRKANEDSQKSEGGRHK